MKTKEVRIDGLVIDKGDIAGLKTYHDYRGIVINNPGATTTTIPLNCSLIIQVPVEEKKITISESEFAAKWDTSGACFSSESETFKDVFRELFGKEPNT